MKISYITSYNALDIHNWSGTSYSIAKSLENQNNNLDYIGDLNIRFNKFFQLKRNLYAKVLKKKYHIDREMLVAKCYAKQALSKLNPRTDIIFSPGSIPIAFMETKIPKVLYTDATFAGMVNFYDSFSNLCNETLKNGFYIDEKAFETSALIIFSSDWAAQNAIDKFKVNPQKVKVVQFGANIDFRLSFTEIKKNIEKRSLSTLNLLFIGVDWKRKGGDFAVSIAKELNLQGVDTKLHVVGLDKLPIQNPPDFIINHGFISKSSEQGRNKIYQLFTQCHFLLVPSVAEAYGIVFCEANAFGLPCLSTNVGGIPSIIKNQINGKVFSLNSDITEWCNYIINLFNDKFQYFELCLSSFNEFEKRLNWQVAGDTINNYLKEIRS